MVCEFFILLYHISTFILISIENTVVTHTVFARVQACSEKDIFFVRSNRQLKFRPQKQKKP